jgi:hypothetical protein
VLELQQGGRVKRQVKWEDARSVEGVGVVSAFEIKAADSPPDMAMQLMAEQLIFGRTSIRGFVHPTADSVVMTFSQRPAVLRSALDVAGNPDSALSSSTVLKSMQSWLPATRDVQVYIGVAELMQLAQHVADAFGAGSQVQLAPANANLPPVAIAADIIDRGVETAMIVPSGVLALLIDQAMEHLKHEHPAEPAELQ